MQDLRSGWVVAVVLGLALSAYSAEGGKGAVGSPELKAPDLKHWEIVEVQASVDSPPYDEPEMVTVNYNRKEKIAAVTYSGLRVQGQGDHHWVEREPGRKSVTQKDYQGLTDLLSRSDQWFTPPRLDEKGILYRPTSFSGLMELTVTLRKRDVAKNETQTVTVLSSSFKDGQVPEEYQAVIRKVGALYGVDLLDIRHYD